jgi:3D (Asp-Asp-Asp) domain-containing protein
VGVIRSWFNVMQGMPVYVPGYGYGSIEDIGGGIAGRHWIDLGFTDENIVPWHNWTTIYFLTPVPSPDRILYILP